MRSRIATALVGLLALLFASCGTGGDGQSSAARTDTADIDVCSLLSDADVSAAIGSAPASEPTEPAGPFTGCKWGSGLLYVQIAPAVTLITAPAETDCPSVGIGEESTVCFGSVKFLTNGIHATVSTIEDLSEAQLTAVAAALLPKLQDE